MGQFRLNDRDRTHARAYSMRVPTCELTESRRYRGTQCWRPGRKSAHGRRAPRVGHPSQVELLSLRAWRAPCRHPVRCCKRACATSPRTNTAKHDAGNPIYMPRSGGASHPQKWVPAPVVRRYPDSVAGIHDSFPVCRCTTPDGKRYSVRGRRANVEKKDTVRDWSKSQARGARGAAIARIFSWSCVPSESNGGIGFATSSLVMQHRGWQASFWGGMPSQHGGVIIGIVEDANQVDDRSASEIGMWTAC